jgi:hypothetical protein
MTRITTNAEILFYRTQAGGTFMPYNPPDPHASYQRRMRRLFAICCLGGIVSLAVFVGLGYALLG